MARARVRKTEIPEESLLRQFMPADYSDTFAAAMPEGNGMSPDDLMVAFWSDFPWWIGSLFSLRNFLVKFVGLKGGGMDIGALERCIRGGEPYGFISVPLKNPNETVMLMTDSHLDAYLSLRRTTAGSGGGNGGGNGEEAGNGNATAIGNGEVFVSTFVKFNNRLGRVYFSFIRPFHGAIVRSQIKRALTNFKTKNQ